MSALLNILRVCLERASAILSMNYIIPKSLLIQLITSSGGDCIEIFISIEDSRNFLKGISMRFDKGKVY